MVTLITDLTYMRGGVCIAGLKMDTLSNIRPVLRTGQIQRDFVDKNNIYPGAIIRFSFIKKVTTPPHTEDHIFEDVEFIEFIDRDRWYQMLEAVAVMSLKSAFQNCIVDNKALLPGAPTGSLVTLRLDTPIRIHFFDRDRMDSVLPFKVRLSFHLDDITYHLPVTDLALIDFCNERFQRGIARELVKTEIESILNKRYPIYLRIGLTRPFKKSEDTQELCYLQVNGIYSEVLDPVLRKAFIKNSIPSHTEKEGGFSPSAEFKKLENGLTFRIFNIPLTDNDKELSEFNNFVHDVDIKRMSAQVVDNRYWSILIGYKRLEVEEKEIKHNKFACESLSELSAEDIGLFEKLKRWRYEKAQRLGVPEYLILQNKTLMTIAKLRPGTTEELMNVHGIGERKIADYGEEIIKLIIDTF